MVFVKTCRVGIHFWSEISNYERSTAKWSWYSWFRPQVPADSLIPQEQDQDREERDVDDEREKDVACQHVLTGKWILERTRFAAKPISSICEPFWRFIPKHCIIFIWFFSCRRELCIFLTVIIHFPSFVCKWCNWMQDYVLTLKRPRKSIPTVNAPGEKKS